MPVTWSDEKLILLYCPGRVRTNDLPHTVASNMGNVSYALTHSATAAVSGPYSTIGNTKAFTSFTFVASLIPLSFHKPPIAALPITILLRISLSHNPYLVINAPRNTKRVTTSTVSHPLSPLQNHPVTRILYSNYIYIMNNKTTFL